jgi:hypothetical protein
MDDNNKKGKNQQDPTKKSDRSDYSEDINSDKK